LAVGVDPLAKGVPVVKSTNHFHADFARITSEIKYCEAGSPYHGKPAANGYRKTRKTIWPIVENPLED